MGEHALSGCINPQFYSLGGSVSVRAFGGDVVVRIGEDGRRCVVFFGVPGPGPEGDAIEYGGTGFLASLDDRGVSFAYLVTCRHVALALKKHEGTGFYVRLNLRGGGSVAMPIGKIDWRFPEDPTVDLAFCHFNFDPAVYDHKFFNMKYPVDRSLVGEIATGDLVSIVGLFRPHAGTGRNVPLVHAGFVAVLADPVERVPIIGRDSDEPIRSEVYLVQTQTLDGCSGSPAFSHDVVQLAEYDLEHSGKHPKLFGASRIMGIYSGSWDGEPGKLLAEDRRLGPNRRVPVGFGTVVPIDQLIHAITEDKIMAKGRDREIAKRETKNAASQDSGFSSPQSNDENPTAREDFTRLVNVAAQKPKQGA